MLFIASFSLYFLADGHTKCKNLSLFQLVFPFLVINRQKQSSKVFRQRGIHRNLTKLTGKDLCRSFFSNNKIAYWRPATLWKRDSSTGIFLWLCETFKNTFNIEHLRAIVSGQSHFDEQSLYKKILFNFKNFFILHTFRNFLM